jgi:hypothetical protein
MASFGIQAPMARLLWVIVFVTGCALAQSGSPADSSDAAMHKAPAAADDLFPSRRPNGKIGLVRGVLERIDPIYDQLVIHIFGGGDVRVGFDLHTKFVPAKADLLLPSIPAGSVVSADTVIDDGKLLALSVNTDTPAQAELSGQVVKFDATRSRLTLRDPISPGSVSVRITPGTNVVDRGQAGSPQALSPGTLVRVWFIAGQDAATQVEILARPGNTFTFEGRILAIDLRLRVLSLSNDSDQSLRELAFGQLDGSDLSLLREGNQVVIQAEFDGERYNVRTITPMPNNP